MITHFLAVIIESPTRRIVQTTVRAEVHVYVPGQRARVERAPGDDPRRAACAIEARGDDGAAGMHGGVVRRADWSHVHDDAVFIGVLLELRGPARLGAGREEHCSGLVFVLPEDNG